MPTGFSGADDEAAVSPTAAGDAIKCFTTGLVRLGRGGIWVKRMMNSSCFDGLFEVLWASWKLSLVFFWVPSPTSPPPTHTHTSSPQRVCLQPLCNICANFVQHSCFTWRLFHNPTAAAPGGGDDDEGPKWQNSKRRWFTDSNKWMPWNVLINLLLLSLLILLCNFYIFNWFFSTKYDIELQWIRKNIYIFIVFWYFFFIL